MTVTEAVSLLALDEGGVAQLLSSFGFPFYTDQIREHGITGDILVHLDHEALKDVGIHSVGQRLAILKHVYELKIEQNVPIEEGHYVPPSDDMDLGTLEYPATTINVEQLMDMLGQRDDRIRNLEHEVQQLHDNFVALRDDGLSLKNKPRPAVPARSPTGNLFPHPLSNASTLSRSNSHSRPRTAADASNAPESPRSPLDFSRLFVESEDPSSRSKQPHFSLHSSTDASQPYTSESLTPTTPTAPLSLSQRQDDRLGGYSQGLAASSVASTSALPPQSVALGRNASTSKQGSERDRSVTPSSTSAPDNPYRSFRVTLEDPCYKVLPAALKKYKINDDWRQYALFICYGNTERCLSYDEKPLLLFQRLKEANANPVFMLRHIKDIKSPIAVASAKHAARKEKRSVNAGAGLDKPPVVNRDGTTLAISRATRLHQPPVLLPVGKDRDRVNLDEEEEGIKSPRETSGFCISIYPYLAEREDEFDVSVGDSFTIISKTKGWWVVHRDYGPNSSHQHPRKSAWVPAGCLLETSVPPLSLADPTISPPLTDASSIPILPRYIVSVSTPGIALMDYVKNGSDELDVVQNTCLRILKRYNHWSYAIKEDTGERGWIPSWFVNKPARSEASPTTPPTGSSDGKAPALGDKRSGKAAPTIELDGIASSGTEAKNVFNIQF